MFFLTLLKPSWWNCICQAQKTWSLSPLRLPISNFAHVAKATVLTIKWQVLHQLLLCACCGSCMSWEHHVCHSSLSHCSKLVLYVVWQIYCSHVHIHRSLTPIPCCSFVIRCSYYGSSQVLTLAYSWLLGQHCMFTWGYYLRPLEATWGLAETAWSVIYAHNFDRTFPCHIRHKQFWHIRCRYSWGHALSKREKQKKSVSLDGQKLVYRWTWLSPDWAQMMYLWQEWGLIVYTHCYTQQPDWCPAAAKVAQPISFCFISFHLDFSLDCCTIVLPTGCEFMQWMAIHHRCDGNHFWSMISGHLSDIVCHWT